MSVGSIVIYHGLVLIGHSDVLVCQRPAGGFHTRFGSSSGCVGVEVVEVGKVGRADVAGGNRCKIGLQPLVAGNSESVGGAGGDNSV